MEKAILPTEKAHEPDEGARNPMTIGMSPHKGQQELISSRRLITFADDIDLSERSASQKSYKEVLSQPAPGLSHRQRLLWLQKHRMMGLWVQCDECDRWRFLSNVLERHELPNKWYCRMNTDSSNADCSVPETPIRLRDEEDLIHSVYSAGSVVWARMPGWPWWPAMVDDCPDTEQFYWLDGFSDIPTHYNVVFFDSTDVTRGWIAPDNLKPYTANKNVMKLEKKHKIRLQSAIKQADDASKLPLEERLGKYSFIIKYNGNIVSPKKVTKKDLIKHQKKMKRRFNVEFPIELESDDDNESLLPNSPMKRRNMIILGTPKKGKTKRIQDSLNVNYDADADSMDIVDVTEPPTLPLKKVASKGHIQNTDMIDTTPVLPTKPGKTRRIIQDSMGIDDKPASPQKGETGLSTNDFKHSNSMAVQVGSTSDTAPIETESYDNDTSKTYVPELRQTLESTDNETEIGTQEFHVRTVTPSSDDFDF